MSDFTPFSPANSDGQVNRIICRAGKDATYNGEYDVANVDVPVSRSYQNTQTNEWEQETAWYRIAGWKNAAARAREVMKGDIIVLDFHLSDIETDPYMKDGQPAASLKIKRARVRVIHRNGTESTFVGEATRVEEEPAEVML
jgi:single-stranded DNA-binding protein